jgi:single-strand DNA-binding protein
MSITISAVGNLGRDPEIVIGDNGRRRARFSLACSRKRGGEELTTWLSCTIFQDGLVNIVESFCQKGRQVHVSGELTMRPYTAKDGSEKLSADVVVDRLTLCGSRNDAASHERHAVASDDQMLNARLVDAGIDAQAPPRAGGDPALKRNVPRFPSGGPEFSDEIPFSPC